MYEDGGNAEEISNYNFLFCHACLTSNRTLTVVGEYIDIYTKICDISYMEDMSSEIYICWECMALLKKIRSFKMKVENAQKVLDFCIDTQIPLYSLSTFTISSTETRTFVPKDIDEYEHEELDKSHIRIESDLKDDLVKLDVKNEDHYDLKELTIKIVDVRSQYEAAKVKPDLEVSLNSSSGCEVSTKKVSPAPPGPDQAYQRWKQSIMLVHKRICGHQHAQHFLRPVSDEIAPLYSRVVRRPADLGTLRQRVRDGVIRTTAQYEQALLLMFSNALMYNSSQDPIYRMAVELRTEALRELSLLSDPPSSSPRTRRRSPLHAPPTPPRAPNNNNTSALPEPDSKPKAVVRRRASHRPKDNKVTPLSDAESKPAAVGRRRASQRPLEASSTPLSEPESKSASVGRRRASQRPREANSTPISEAESKPASVGRRRASLRPREVSSTPLSEPESKPAGISRRRASQRPREATSTPLSEPESRPAGISRRRTSQWTEPRPQEPKKLVATKRRASAWNWLTLDLDSELLVARHSTKKYKTVLL